MPFFNTGNAQWDQGFNTLGGALFPDPSKIGQATYYGAEARAKQIEAAKLQEQLAYKHRLDIMSGGNQPPPASYPPTGPLGIPTMQDPSLAQTVAPGPAVAPPPATPPPAQAMPAASPPPPTVPAAGTVGANLPPGGLSALFAQGGGPVPTQQPTVVGQGPNGGAIIQPTMTPQEVADRTPAIVDAHPNLTQGTPPPVSPPAPGAPPASNATGSDGSVPNNDASSGTFHPGSITPPGGGWKLSGPANADGSPARPAPMFTQAQYVATAVNSGMDAAQASLQWRSYIQSLYDKGMLDENSYHHAMGSADPTIINTDTTNAANIKRTGMEVAGRTYVAGMEIAGRKDVAGMPLQDIVSPTDPTQVTRVPLGALQNPQGTPSYNPNAVTQAVTPVLTQPGGPGTPPQSTPQFKAGGQPIYQPTVEADRQKPANYIDPKNPTQLLPRTFDQAQKEGLVAAPTTMEGWNALAASASANARTPEEAQAIRDKVLAFATASTPKPVDARENVRNQNIIDRQLQTLMPVPPSDFPGSNTLTNLKPAGASPELGMTLSNLTDQYFQRSTDPAIRGNRIAAANAALKQMIAQGYINPQQSRAQGIRGQTSINKGVLNQDGTVDQVEHFRVDLIDPKTKQPYPAGQSPDIKMTTPLSSVVTSGGNKGTMPPGALGPAPPGVPDGTPGTTSTGQRGVVRGGWVFPAS